MYLDRGRNRWHDSNFINDEYELMADTIWTKASESSELPMGDCLVRYRYKNKTQLSYVISHRAKRGHVIGGYFNYDFDSAFDILAYASIDHLMDAEVET